MPVLPALPPAIALGPLLLPTGALAFLASVVAGQSVGRRLARRRGLEIENTLWLLLAVGLVAARLGFVAAHLRSYLAAPGAVLDVRDGGWSLPTGLAAAGLAALRAGAREARGAVLAAVAAAAVPLVLAGVALRATPGAPRPLPDLALSSLDGRTVRLAGFAGRPTVVNLWATWCPPCAREMPVLRDGQARWPGVDFVFIDQGEPAPVVAAYLRAHGLSLRHVLVDPSRRAGAVFGQAGYPTTLFFDATGALVSVRVGELSAATLEERVESLLPPSTAASGTASP